MQSYLRALSDEAENPSSSFSRLTGTQQEELRKLLDDCRTDLEELKTTVARYKSLGKTNPRTRDRMGFTKTKQAAIRDGIRSHSDRLQRFLNAATIGTVSRIEAHTESHVWSLAEIRARLDGIHDDIRAGRRAPTILTDLDGLLEVEDEILQDGTSDVDVDLRSEISDWITRVRVHSDIEDMVRQTVEDDSDVAMTTDTIPERADTPTEMRKSNDTNDDLTEIDYEQQNQKQALGSDGSTGISRKENMIATDSQGSNALADEVETGWEFLDLRKYSPKKLQFYDELRRVTATGTAVLPTSQYVGGRSSYVVEVFLGPEEIFTTTMRRFFIHRLVSKLSWTSAFVSRYVETIRLELQIAAGTVDGYRICYLGHDRNYASRRSNIIFEIVSTHKLLQYWFRGLRALMHC